jgi:hypothetical protein
MNRHERLSGASLDHGKHHPSGGVFHLDGAQAQGSLKIRSRSIIAQRTMAGLIFAFFLNGLGKMVVEPGFLGYISFV